MKHIDVCFDEFRYLAKEAGWGPQQTTIQGWLSKTFHSYVRIGDQMVRIGHGYYSLGLAVTSDRSRAMQVMPEAAEQVQDAL